MINEQRAMWNVRVIGNPSDAVAQLLDALDAHAAALQAWRESQLLIGTVSGDEELQKVAEQALFRLNAERGRFVRKGVVQ